MEFWILLFVLVSICALGAFGIGGSWRDRIRGTPFGLRQSHLRHVTYEGFRDWRGPNNYKGPNQGMWHGWDSEASDMGGNWGWYGWSYPWAWYGPVEFAVDCYSNADCGEKSFCGSNGYCMKRDDI